MGIHPIKVSIPGALLAVGCLAFAGCASQTAATSTSSSTAHQAEASSSTTSSSPSANSCANAIDWSSATSAIGQTATVKGPVVSAHYAVESRGHPTFLDVGLSYPDPSRFEVVIWGESRPNFNQPPEQTYDSRQICVTGSVQEYAGYAEVIVSSPSQIVTP